MYHTKWMLRALRAAERAFAEEEVPVGAVVVYEDRVIAEAYNQREQLNDPTAHAEMLAITQASAALQSSRLESCCLYVTLEPCPMCAGAILQSRIPQVVYGTPDPKMGAVDSTFRLLNDARMNHRADVVSGVLRDECRALLQQFFRQVRDR